MKVLQCSSVPTMNIRCLTVAVAYLMKLITWARIIHLQKVVQHFGFETAHILGH